MRQLCMRSACNGPAVVLVIMNHSELTFTIRAPGEIDGPGRVVLCETHLGRMKAPIGWTIIDERPGGDVIALRPSSKSEEVEVNPQPITEATHPLRSRSTESNEEDSSVKEMKPSTTTLLARACLGVDRLPAATTFGSAVDEDDASVLAGCFLLRFFFFFPCSCGFWQSFFSFSFNLKHLITFLLFIF